MSGIRLHISSVAGVPEPWNARHMFEQMSSLDSVGRHRYEPDPDRADAILFVDLHQHLDDPLARRLTRHPLAQRRPDRVFVYDERDFPAYTLPGIYVSAPTRWSTVLPVVGGPYPALSPRAPRMSAAELDLLFSFRGGTTHRIREKIFALSHPRAVIERTSVNRFPPGHGVDPSTAHDHQRFTQLIERSKFVLCPRGHGLSSFRLYEVLAAGRVPVVISDEWLPPPRLDWDGAIVRISERNIPDLPHRLEAIEDDWPAIESRARALAVNLQPDRLWDHYAASIEQLMRTPRSRVPLRAAAPIYGRRAHVHARRFRDALR